MSDRVQDRQAKRAAARKPLDDYDTSPYGLSRANRRARLDKLAPVDNGRSNRSDAPPAKTARAKRIRESRAYKRMARKAGW
jgi:hypothetical protein